MRNLASKVSGPLAQLGSSRTSRSLLKNHSGENDELQRHTLYLAMMGSLSETFQRAPFNLLLDAKHATADTIRSLPDLIHFNAIHNPHFLFCIQFKQSKRGPVEKDIGEVYVTFSELATAIEQCCVWILSKVKGIHPARLTSDGSVQKDPPVALFLESDVTLFVYMMALLTMNVPVGCCSRTWRGEMTS